MASESLALRISAKTDEFVKSVEDAKTKVRSLSMQMAEIDKQLKTENVDRVKKLADKLDLAKRASEAAAKEAELYGDKVKKLTDKNEDLNNLTDRQKESLLKLSEQMATAQQKANTYAAEVDKLSKELDETSAASDQAEKEIEDVAEATEIAGKSAMEGAKGISSFGESVLSNLVSSLIEKGVSNAINLFKNLASAAWNAAKSIASAAKNYATEAVDLAADYADALGYSEQVFTNQAEAPIRQSVPTAAVISPFCPSKQESC